MEEVGFLRVERTTVERFYSVKSQRYFEMIYFLDGEGTLWLSGSKHRVSHGSFAFVTPLDLVRIQIDEGSVAHAVFCRFDWQFGVRLGGLPAPQRSAIDDVFTVPQFVDFSEDDRVIVENLLEKMAEEEKAGGAWGRLATSALLLSLDRMFHREAVKQLCEQGGGR